MVGTLVRWCRCTTSWCDIDLTFDLAEVTLTHKIRGISQKMQGIGSWYLVETLVGDCRCAMSWWDLELTFDLAIVTLTYKSSLDYILETVRCRKLLLGRDFG